ncbi:unnamed protein product [Miscanthus lutarioriparius]|uniref:Uncharacterized protein n=1 Tax=Miscanthus lutarioriparius TaxID=422564 RepID=A0A811PMQ0_9POAL|nr:unnamed protein product [Miscanthus lutarioriparius]
MEGRSSPAADLPGRPPLARGPCGAGRYPPPAARRENKAAQDLLQRAPGRGCCGSSRLPQARGREPPGGWGERWAASVGCRGPRTRVPAESAFVGEASRCRRGPPAAPCLPMHIVGLSRHLKPSCEMRPPKLVQGRLKLFTLHTTQEDFNIDISDVTGVSQTLPPQPVHQQPPHCPRPLARPRSEEDDDDDDFMQPPSRHPVTNNNQRRTTNVVVNARRDGKLQKKNAPHTDPPTKPKQQKVTNYLHAPTVRCAPSVFNSFIDLLTMSQHTRINNMNFSGLLQIRTDKLVSREMLKYFYDRLDPDTMVLVLGKDRVIHINPFAVKQAFDIPDSGEELSLHTNQRVTARQADADAGVVPPRESAHIPKLKAPVILVGCKLDLRDAQQVSLEQVMVPIMQSFREILRPTLSGPLQQIQVPEVFYYAQKATQLLYSLIKSYNL